MAVTTAHTKAELARIMNLAYEGEAITACLINALSAVEIDDPIETWLQHEVLPVSNGYYRFYSGGLPAGEYSYTSESNEQPVLDIEFSASGGSITYTHILLLLDAYSIGQYTSGEGPSSLVGTVSLSTGVDLTEDELTLDADYDDVSDDDVCTVTLDQGGTIPTGLTAGTRYYIKTTAVDKITLHTATPVASGNIVDITATGEGTLRVRRCRGSVYNVMEETAANVINDSAKVGYKTTILVDD